MMNDFKRRVIATIRSDFAKYLDLKDRINTTETKKRYMDDLNEYIENHLTSMTLLDNYAGIFNKIDIRGFLQNRKSATAKYALSNLLHFYHFNKKITDSEYLEIQNELKKYKSKRDYEADFLTREDLKYILDRLFVNETKSNEDYYLIKPIIVLSYQYFYEQTHIMNLKWEDINFQAKKIKNPRFYDDPLVIEWLELDSIASTTFEDYRKYYFDSCGGIKPTSYFLMHNRDNVNAINNILGVINDRSIFYRHISTRVGLQKIIRSKILLDLENTSGKSLMSYYEIFGIRKGTQLTSSIKEYLARAKSKMANSIT